jgi:NAD(P)-dependent dehydrogenase (short-subunit alcohol dehydrogenase family)
MKSVRELMNLKGRVALVTGGGGHIGRALCHALAELEAGVAVLDVDEGRCCRVAEELANGYSVQATPLVVDLQQEEQTRATCETVLERLGRLDILVHCAAFVGTSGLAGWATDFASQSPAAWRQAVELNLTVPFVLTQACAPALQASGHGSVINIASIYGVVGPDLGLYEGTKLGNPAAYSASKGGLLQLTRWLATVLAPDVRVNAITPGGIERGQAEAFRTRYVARTPLGRLGTEEDLKGAVAYLASDLSAYVTGQNLIVDGGWTAW